MRKPPPEVVYVERGSDSSAKWLFWGACLGAGLALMYAPRNGEETRRSLQRRLWKLRAITEEKVSELVEQYTPGRTPGGAGADDEFSDEDDFADEFAGGAMPPEPDAIPAPSAREELERRLAEARARRRQGSAPSDEFEEPPV